MVVTDRQQRRRETSRVKDPGNNWDQITGYRAEVTGILVAVSFDSHLPPHLDS